jgi:Methyladenine glycosylase
MFGAWNYDNQSLLLGERGQSANAPIPRSDLKQRGFSFVGSTVVYAYMQSVGMVNDHLIDCFRYREIRQLSRTEIAKS